MALWGVFPLSSWPGQMLRVTSKVVERASHWGKQKCFSNQDWSLQFRAAAVWKGCHLWHNHTNICGLQHFASVWKGIFVSLRRLPQIPCFVNTWVAFSVSETEIRLCIKHTENIVALKHNCAHTVHKHRGGPCMRKWVGFTPRVKTKQGRGLGVWQIVFLSAKVQTSRNLPKCGKCLPISTLSLPSCPPCQFLRHSPSA